jgi:pilus assembly protein Flp/PilA
MNTSIRKFLVEEDGVTALEYGVLAAIMAVTLIAVFGGNDDTKGIRKVFVSIFNSISTTVSNLNN